ncbi:MAG: site-specific DNA-methyltransferase, partial [Candidatus Kapaibacterium sp.]
MAKKVESIKHKGNTRPHIPSKEEAGYEDANEKVTEGKKILELPKNPVVHRGQDPELFWLNKYGNDDRDDLLRVDIRSLYRHEHIAPETLIKYLYKLVDSDKWVVDSKTGEKKLNTNHYTQTTLFDVNELFGNALEKDEIEKVSEYYHHQDGWTNRLIQGDSHLVMASLLEREGMAGQVQTVYFDPPYGIKYGGNWQIKLNNRDVKDGNDEALTGEPEQIKAFRDTWELGIHSYLSYLRDRLLIAKELLTESGSCFVQIGDENVHLVRSVMDEVFGSENFISQITVSKTSGLGQKYLDSVSDFIIWFGKNKEQLKFRPLFLEKVVGGEGGDAYKFIETPEKQRRRASNSELENFSELAKKGYRFFRLSDIRSQSGNEKAAFTINFEGKQYHPKHLYWKTSQEGINNLIKKNRIVSSGNSLNYVRFADDFPAFPLNNIWDDLSSGVGEKYYVVQTNAKIVQRCILMTTDPGDLVLDPTCGSGTTAFLSEQWGRRWITIDTSRIALNIAKQRLMTAVFPYYKLYDEEVFSSQDKEVFSSQFSVSSEETTHSELKTKHSELKTKNFPDIRQGFKYKTVPHITLKSLANDEPPATETLYDQPETDNKKLRVSGPFTVETLQNFEPIPVDSDEWLVDSEDNGKFEEVIKQHLISAGIKNGRKDEMVVFRSVELLAGEALHAEGFYQNGVGEKKAYFHIGPKFGTVSKKLVNDAIKECRQKGDANWLIILGFSFESDIEGGTQTTS